MIHNYLKKKVFKISPKPEFILLVSGVISVIFIQLFMRSFVIVTTGEVGIIENSEKNLATPLLPGKYWVNPLDKVVKISTRIRVGNETIKLTSQEGINFSVNIGLLYHIDPRKSSYFYRLIGNQEKAILRENLAFALRSVASQYVLKDLYSNKNNEIANKVQSIMNRLLSSQGLIIDQISLTRFDFPKTVEISLQKRFLVEQEAEERKIQVKEIAETIKNLQGLITIKIVINVAADDSILSTENKP